jgi:predicted secreted protein with PEFG-CTERM motif
MKKLDPNEANAITSPTTGIVYRATEAGIVNANLTLKYDIGNSYTPGQSKMENTTSKLFSFTISRNNTFPSTNFSTVPEFPFAVLVLLVSITSLIVFTRIKFRK